MSAINSRLPAPSTLELLQSLPDFTEIVHVHRPKRKPHEDPHHHDNAPPAKKNHHDNNEEGGHMLEVANGKVQVRRPGGPCRLEETESDLLKDSPEVEWGLVPQLEFGEAEEEILHEMMSKAEMGEDFQNLLPMIWRPGVPPCCQKEFVKFFKRLAASGDCTAFYVLGMAAFKAYGGIEQDEAKALIFINQAADLGSAYAINTMGVFYENGFCGLPVNSRLAVKCYHRAALMKNGNGQCNLGICYQRGYGGLQKDHPKALQLFGLSADQGNACGQVCLGLAHYWGESGLETDRAKAAEYFELAAAQGNADGEDMLGFQYMFGYGVEKDETNGFNLVARSALQGNPSGMRDLGMCYFLGIGIKKDPSRSCYWYQKAASFGDKMAIEALRYLRHTVEEFDLVKAEADQLIEAHNDFVQKYLKERQKRSEKLE